MERTINGFIQRARMSLGRLILVEGASDRQIVGTIIAGVEHGGHPLSTLPDIYRADKITIPAGLGIFGFRELVEHIYRRCREIRVELTCIVDREFRRFDFQQCLDLLPASQDAGNRLYWTCGHSIENLLLQEKLIRGVVDVHLGAICESTVRQRLCGFTDNVVRLAAAFSGMAYERGHIARSYGILSQAPWLYDRQTGIKIDFGRVRQLYIERGVADVEVRAIERSLLEWNTKLEHATIDFCRSMCHGHFGWEAVWSALLFLLTQLGERQEVVEAFRRIPVETIRKELAFSFGLDLARTQRIDECALLRHALS